MGLILNSTGQEGQTAFFRKLAWLAGRRRKEDHLTAELQFHLEEAEEHQAAGMPPTGCAMGGAAGTRKPGLGARAHAGDLGLDAA